MLALAARFALARSLLFISRDGENWSRPELGNVRVLRTVLRSQSCSNLPCPRNASEEYFDETGVEMDLGADDLGGCFGLHSDQAGRGANKRLLWRATRIVWFFERRVLRRPLRGAVRRTVWSVLRASAVLSAAVPSLLRRLWTPPRPASLPLVTAFSRRTSPASNA